MCLASRGREDDSHLARSLVTGVEQKLGLSWRAQAEKMNYVHQLMREVRRGWDIGELRSIFCEQDVDVILKIQLSDKAGNDWLAWKYMPHGVYTVNSGHKVAIQRSLAFQPQSSHHRFSWRSVWDPFTPNEFLNYLWRAAKDY